MPSHRCLQMLTGLNPALLCGTATTTLRMRSGLTAFARPAVVAGLKLSSRPASTCAFFNVNTTTAATAATAATTARGSLLSPLLSPSGTCVSMPSYPLASLPGARSANSALGRGLHSSRSFASASGADSSSTTAASAPAPPATVAATDLLADTAAPVAKAAPLFDNHATAGEVAAAGLDTGFFSPIRVFLETYSAQLESPWWVVIVVSGLLTRVVLMPIVLYSQRMSLRMTLNAPVLGEFRRRMEVAKLQGLPQSAIIDLIKEQRAFQKLANLRPFRSLLSIILMGVVFFGLFRSLHLMLRHPIESMKTGGPSWLPDLTLPEPTHIWPAVSAFLIWVSMQISVNYPPPGSPPSPFPPVVKKFMVHGIPLVAAPVSFFLPAGVLFYMIPTQVYGIAQALAFRVPLIRSALSRGIGVSHIPPTKVPQLLELPNEAHYASGKLPYPSPPPVKYPWQTSDDAPSALPHEPRVGLMAQVKKQLEESKARAERAAQASQMAQAQAARPAQSTAQAQAQRQPLRSESIIQSAALPPATQQSAPLVQGQTDPVSLAIQQRRAAISAEIARRQAETAAGAKKQ